MADWSMFGPASSPAAVAQSYRMSEMAMQKTAGQIAKQPLELQELQADVELKNLNLQSARREQSILSQMSTGVPNWNTSDDPAKMAIDQLNAYGNALILKGLPVKGAGYLEKAAQIASHKAQASSASALQTVRQYEAANKQIEMGGQLASSVTDQASLDRMLLRSTELGIDMSDVPHIYEDAKPVLKEISDLSVKASDKYKAEAKRLTDAHKAEQDATMTRLREARIRALNTSMARTQQQIDLHKKIDGPKSASVAELDKLRIEQLKERTSLTREQEDALLARTYPPAPENPKARELNKTYTVGNKRYQWVKEGDQTGWREVPKRTGSSSAAQEIIDSTEGEEDE